MKCLLLIFTLCSLERFIDVQGKDDGHSNNLGDSSPEQASVSYEVTDSQETPEQSAYGDESSSETESPVQKPRRLQPTGASKDNDEKNEQQIEAAIKQFLIEMEAGDTADLIGQNQHIKQSSLYNDLGRRYEPQALVDAAAENIDIIPEKAPPEVVLLVAKESALLKPSKDTDLRSNFDRKKILRSGDYWNAVWKEEITPKSVMRSAAKKKNLGSIKAKIKPGTEFFKVVSRMKKISPQLIYIINKKQL